MNPNMIGDHAVVLGGSMAGLLVARVLADAYNRVTVVECDDLCDSVAPRRGVPQGRHIHGLIARGGQILDELLPGFTESLPRAECRRWTSSGTRGCTSADTGSGRPRAA